MISTFNTDEENNKLEEEYRQLQEENEIENSQYIESEENNVKYEIPDDLENKVTNTKELNNNLDVLDTLLTSEPTKTKFSTVEVHELKDRLREKIQKYVPILDKFEEDVNIIMKMKTNGDKAQGLIELDERIEIYISGVIEGSMGASGLIKKLLVAGAEVCETIARIPMVSQTGILLDGFGDEIRKDQDIDIAIEGILRDQPQLVQTLSPGTQLGVILLLTASKVHTQNAKKKVS